MKTNSTFAVLSSALILAACSSSEPSVAGAPSADGPAVDEVVGGDARGRPVTEGEPFVDTGLASIAEAFALTSGASKPEDLSGGDCHRAFTTNKSLAGVTISEFANGAIFTPKAEGPRTGVCVDLHGANKISVSGVVLDATSRYGLGRLTEVAKGLGPGEPHDLAHAELRFEKGTVLVKYSSIDGANLGSLFEAPSNVYVEDGGPSIAGRLHQITMKEVTIHQLIGDRTVQGDFQINGTTAWAVYRHAWSSTNPLAGAPSEDRVGAFTRKVDAAGDAGGYSATFNFANLAVTWTQVHNMSPTDPRLSESIAFKRGADTVAFCSHGLPAPPGVPVEPQPFECDGL